MTGKSLMLVASPWKNDPLESFRKYDYKDAKEDFFAAAFQVNEQMADLRVSRITPVGVRSLGGVPYVALLAIADREAEKAQAKRRVVDPTKTTESTETPL